MSNERKALIASIILFLLAIALLLWSLRQRAQPPQDNQLEQRVADIEAWQDYVDPQIRQHGLDINDLQEWRKLDSESIDRLDADMAKVIEQLYRIENKEIHLHIDTTWIMNDSISIIGFKDSIQVRTKKR